MIGKIPLQIKASENQGQRLGVVLNNSLKQVFHNSIRTEQY